MKDTASNPATDAPVYGNILTAHEHILFQAVEQSPAAVVITDEYGVVEYVNRKYVEVTGYAEAELIGHNLSLLKAGDLPPAFYAELKRKLSAGEAWRGEFHNRRKDGGVYLELASIVPIRDDHGGRLHYLKIAEDVTDRRRMEQELREAYDGLQAKEQALRTSYDQLAVTSRALQESERQLRRLAQVDTLTGLLNRRGFEHALHRELALVLRQNGSVGILIVDVDHFKQINDLHGHAAGDAVLRECGSLLRENLRASDVICRHGGDELVVALPMSTPAETRAAAERMLDAVRRHAFQDGAHALRVTVSIGAACGPPGPDASFHHLLVQADQALYRAKHTGRDRACFTEPHTADPEPRAAVAPAAGGAEGNRPGRVLVVDDDPSICRIFEHLLEGAGFDVQCCTTAQEARVRMEQAQGTLDVVLVDINLRGESGLDLLRVLRQKDDSLIGIVVTGAATLDSALEAMRSGAFDFVAKPVQGAQMLAVLDRALAYRRLLLENRNYQQHLEDLVREKSSALARTLEQLRNSYRFTLETLVAMIDAREKDTGDHSKRVSRMACVLARQMKVSPAECAVIGQGALLHDIGKIAIPDAILLKPGPLTAQEWTVVRSHPQVGYSILQSGLELDKAAEIVLMHQERFDGTGYPRGLKGEEICLGARIFAVVDAYDAIRANRPYAAGRPPREALREIQRCSGSQFDPRVVEALAACADEVEAARAAAVPDEPLCPAHA